MTADSCVKQYDGVSNVNPLLMLKNVGKVVEITTIFGRSVKGTVVTIDPVTGSYLLTIADSDKLHLKVIMGHAVKSFSVLDEQPVSFNLTYSNEERESSGENCDNRLIRVKEWLEKNLIPVEVDNGVIKIEDTVSIHPPYGTQNVLSSNEMVLHKILGIIERMPEKEKSC